LASPTFQRRLQRFPPIVCLDINFQTGLASFLVYTDYLETLAGNSPNMRSFALHTFYKKLVMCIHKFYTKLVMCIAHILYKLKPSSEGPADHRSALQLRAQGFGRVHIHLLLVCVLAIAFGAKEVHGEVITRVSAYIRT
jgi:hypothetical protein